MILDLTELEADYVTQALTNELQMAVLMDNHPDAFEPEVRAATVIKIGLLSGIILRLTETGG